MIHITITEEVEKVEDFSSILQEISFKVQKGYVEGTDPNWYTMEHDKEKLEKV